MAYFNYTAKDPQGKIIHGSVEAINSYEVSQLLAKDHYIVTTIKEVRPKSEVASSLLLTLQGFLSRIKTQDLLFFYLQLSVMISAGVPIINALEIIQNQVRNAHFKKILGEVALKIRQGRSFSDALSDYPAVFPKILISTARAGEASGELDKVLKNLADFSELMMRMGHDVKAALTYPIFLAVIGTAITIFLIMFVIPGFMDVFARADVTLPLPTRILGGLSYFLKTQGLKYFPILFGVFISGAVFIHLPFGRNQLDRLKMRLPILGPIVSGICFSRFSHTLSILLTTGVPILLALEITSENIGNIVLMKELEAVSQKVRDGKELSSALVGTHFSYNVIQMVKVGETTGKLGFSLDKVGELYDMNILYQIKRITALIEPTILLFGGAGVGFIMASIILPMFDMLKTLQR